MCRALVRFLCMPILVGQIKHFLILSEEKNFDRNKPQSWGGFDLSVSKFCSIKSGRYCTLSSSSVQKDKLTSSVLLTASQSISRQSLSLSNKKMSALAMLSISCTDFCSRQYNLRTLAGVKNASSWCLWRMDSTVASHLSKFSLEFIVCMGSRSGV